MFVHFHDMITPVFRILQDEESLTFLITAPHARIADAQVLTDGSEVKFFAAPYFLRYVTNDCAMQCLSPCRECRLRLPGQLDDREQKVSYDFDTGVFTIKVSKARRGEVFDGLDMITSLLSVPKHRVRQPLIQEVGDEVGRNEKEEECDDEVGEGEDEIEWCLEEALPDEEYSSLLGEKYGFANQKSNIFQRLDEEVSLAIDLKDPDTKSRAARRRERLSDECYRFDEDYYLSCLYEDRDTIQRLIQQGDLYAKTVDLDETDFYDMKNLPVRNYLLDEREKKRLLFGLVDILFAYAYDHRTCEGEHTPESNWTISKISATLSWLETFDNMSDVVTSCYTRALIFPLFRHYELSMTVMADVLGIIRRGRKSCLKCLLEIRRLFNQTLDSKYILNDLYISDYCVWIQKVKDRTLEKVAAVLEKAMNQVSKDELALDLVLLEKAASLTLEDEEEGKSQSCDEQQA